MLDEGALQRRGRPLLELLERVELALQVGGRRSWW